MCDREREKAKVGIACQLLTSQDPITRHVSTIFVMHEGSLNRAKFKPMLAAREVMADDPGAKHRAWAKRSRNLVATEDNKDRLAHAKSLIVQGQLHHLDDADGASLWSDVVQDLPPECMKFALNASQDILPHNANLCVCGGRRLASLISASSAVIDRPCFMCSTTARWL